MRGVGVNSEGGGTTSFTNVTNYFYTPITTRSGASGIGPKDGGGGIESIKDGGGGIGSTKDGGNRNRINLRWRR
jgi:hypothetical protein